MKQFKALCRKELKEFRRTYQVPLALLITAVLFVAYHAYFPGAEMDHFEFRRAYIRHYYDIFFFLKYSIPILLAYTLTKDWKLGTIYQLHQIPLYRTWFIIGKLFSALAASILISFGQQCVDHLMWMQHPNPLINPSMQKIIIFFPRVFAPFFLFISLTILAWCFARAVRRLQLFLGLSSFFIGFICVDSVRINLRKIQNIREHIHYQPYYWSDGFDTNFFFLSGIILIASGIYLYNRFSEV